MGVEFLASFSLVTFITVDPICLELSFESGRSRVRIPLALGFFRGRVIPVTQKLALQWLPCQAPGIIWSALGLVGPMSVYCDWVR